MQEEFRRLNAPLIVVERLQIESEVVNDPMDIRPLIEITVVNRGNRPAYNLKSTVQTFSKHSMVMRSNDSTETMNPLNPGGPVRIRSQWQYSVRDRSRFMIKLSLEYKDKGYNDVIRQVFFYQTVVDDNNVLQIQEV